MNADERKAVREIVTKWNPSNASEWVKDATFEILDALDAAEQRAERATDHYAGLWGELCPDIGPEPWEALVRWAAENVNAPERVRAMERVIAVLKSDIRHMEPFRLGNDLRDALAALEKLDE
jgi:hypothetical protein